MALTRCPGELGLTAGLDDLAVGGHVTESGLGSLRFRPQLAVVLQNLDCRGLGHFRVQCLQRRGGGGREVLIFIITDVPGITGVAGKLVKAGGLLAFHRQRVGLGAVLDEAGSQRETESEQCCQTSPFSSLPYVLTPTSWSLFPVSPIPPPKPKDHVKSLWAAHCWEAEPEPVRRQGTEATVPADGWRGARIPSSEGQRGGEVYNSSSSACPHPRENW